MDYCAGDTVGPYQVLRLLGRGSFGVVLLAKDPRLPPQHQQQFALKLVPCDHLDVVTALKSREAAMAEAELLRRLRHPHIVLCHEMGWDASKSVVWLSLDLMDGGDVQSIIDARRKTGQPPPESKFVRQVLAAVGSALDYVHGQGILHRDVKSSNVLLTRKPRTIKLADFGISKILEATGNAYTLVGTPYYMSPELVRGQAYGPASDAWSLGCCLYELSALARPFEATNQLALAGKIVETNPPALPPHTDRDIVTVVFGLLEKDPERRMLLSQVLRVSKGIASLVPLVIAVPDATLPALPSPRVDNFAFHDTHRPRGNPPPESPLSRDTSSPLPQVEELQQAHARNAASFLEEELELTLPAPVSGHGMVSVPQSEKPMLTPRQGNLVGPLQVVPQTPHERRGSSKNRGEARSRGRRWLAFGRALRPNSGPRKAENEVTLVSAFEDFASDDVNFAVNGEYAKVQEGRRRAPMIASPLTRHREGYRQQRDNYRHILTPVRNRLDW